MLMEEGAALHGSEYTQQERVPEGITKVNWPPNSPDFNPIERIGEFMMSRIQTRRGSERISKFNEMDRSLKEQRGKITIKEINKNIAKLPMILRRCIEVNGGNTYRA
ncbi:hypothetical protein FN846DRAFT_894190 [Sphaerosporella brunnea]|uniref:Tc1-like transposase DDE domain-containing protein n=1 Tax=Sphaerosporella brunnea TaxID=1250544 RepID=A0A5J5EIB4_9PEZI|nr:hypothetical protein FN846DRAFT_894190 [Sphaerosporella brunnea]